MKQTTALLLIACLITGTVATAQTISHTQKNATLKDILKVIEKQAGYGYIIKGEATKRAKRVDISVSGASVTEVLDIFFKEQPLTYSITGKIISIQPAVAPEGELTLSGRITNEMLEPIPGATVAVVGGTRVTAGNDDGEFLLRDIGRNARLLITSVNYEPKVIDVQGQSVIHVQLIPKPAELCEVAVVVSTGYQNLLKEKNPGSYTKVNNELLNRRVSPNVLDRLDGVTGGLIFNKNIVTGTNQSTITIRGRSTIFSNAEPLIVVDNFPYPGNPDNINPNDVENITVLKDANAAAIWGAFAGNGVIVINTKKGRYKQAPRLTLNSNVTIGAKPDAYYLPTLETNKFIDLERKLFEEGRFDDMINSPTQPVLSPVVELLEEERRGLTDTAVMLAQLAWWRNQDTRREIDRYFYRNSVSQQYALSTSGGGVSNHYYLSAGYDQGQHNLVGNKSSRITLNANNTYAWFKNRLELSTSIAYSESQYTNNNTGLLDYKYPYLKFFDSYNRAIPIPLGVRQAFKDEVSSLGYLKDWNYYPVEEINLTNNTNKIVDYRINIGVKYKLAKGFNLSAMYQFNKGRFNQDNFRGEETFFTRHLVNSFTQVSSNGTEITKPVHESGGISDRGQESYNAHNARLQLNYTHSWKTRNNTLHKITALSGVEVRDINTKTYVRTLYGITPEFPDGKPVDTTITYQLYYSAIQSQKIPSNSLNRTRVDRYISYYFTSAYTLSDKYTFSISARKDESNLFGVRANRKGIPLMSFGSSWDIGNERFFTWHWLSRLRLKATYGYSGNVNRSVTAYTTAAPSSFNGYGALTNEIINPLNPDLRWEKIQITNFGLDFSFAKDIVETSIEYYIKKGTDLIGKKALNSTTGNTQILANTAEMKGSGIDISITTINMNRKIRWETVLLFNKSTDKVTGYDMRQNSISYYSPIQFNPLEDHPLYSVYSLRWGGLDPQNGDPLGYMDDTLSKNYSAILNSREVDDLIYNGPANPVWFGSLRNTFSFKQFVLSFNITWKLGHYFRRNSIEYSGLLGGRNPGHPDYDKRWQKTGDEQITNIPSFAYSTSSNRDQFFRFSEVLVEKGDHLRMQDIQISYDLTRNQVKGLPMQLIRFYFYANNIGILWKATDKSVDPDYVSSIPDPKTFSVGIKLEF